MKSYAKRLKEEDIFQSMSKKANCLDNSVIENFFGILKQEIYYGVIYRDYNKLKLAIKKYIKYYLFKIKIYYKKHMIFKNRIKK